MKWYSVTELADTLKIPDATIRRYVRQHGHHIQVRKNHNVYQIAEESLPLLTKIRELYATAGMMTDQVNEALAAAHVPIIMTVDDVNDRGEVVALNIPEALSRLEKSMIERMDRLENIVVAQHVYIEDSLKVRDEQLMQGLRQIAASKGEIQAKKKWWRFGK
ncbi:MerR family transcriptional regulator [Paenibacillus sp. LHD-38]|uniref:MerR family transcriptional regulator n=1 Tax=Paenibacillus sp. LHD-38 TaxID=3072143 RepID=UPI0028104678|nr:MerR family transcriptional regulator [Paenibacillus sp. LHD-38]MDQ8737127.1 MerR family transcriptional regulator [Paenibacillus sp. LHD-38]